MPAKMTDISELNRALSKLLTAQPLIIVEGKRDEEALKELGFHKIMPLTKPLFAVVEDVARTEKVAVVLTDLDSKGKELYGTLSEGLRRNGVLVDDSFRKFLLRNMPVKHIEGLATFVKNQD